MKVMIRARSLPYQPDLRAHQRVCTRCGITYTYNNRRDPHITECRDCRGVE